MERLWAHSVNALGVRHPLEDHLRGTAARASMFGEVFCAGELAGYLGLCHDVGKGDCGWQERLLRAERDGGRVGGDHKLAGTILAHRQVGFFSAAVYGHHGGLPSISDLKRTLKEEAQLSRPQVNEVIERVMSLVPELRRQDPVRIPPFTRELEFDLLLRLVFSAVVDADFLDTEEHFQHQARPAHPFLAGDLVDTFEVERSKLLADRPSAPVDKLRQEVYGYAVSAAKASPGMFRMPAPTGSGKTIAAAGFALHHARHHGLRRVIVAVPYISITEQNAAVYRRLLPDRAGIPLVLEHHSGVDLDDATATGQWSAKLAAENWDSPFIVTTTVRLFESLFDRRPAAMRRLHRLARSVIVLDEVQALPDRLLIPILSALRTLTELFGTTVLLTTATQPHYWSLSPFQGLPVHDVIPQARQRSLYSDLRRVRYTWFPGRPTLREVAAKVAAERQVLAIVNTTKDSANLHHHVEEKRDPALGLVYHLSTRMAAQHRRDVLERVRAHLAAGEPVAVVATPLVEAGVDLDFPVVYRAFSSADSLQQAAGRANREGRLNQGLVVIFDPCDGGHPTDQSYNAALATTRSHFGPGKALPDDLDALAEYYPQRYGSQNLGLPAESGPAKTPNGALIEKWRRELDFPRVANGFRMIEELTVPVIVRYDGIESDVEVDDILRRLRRGNATRQDLRALQPYIATIPRWLAARGELCVPVIGDLYEWVADYHPMRGVDITEQTIPDDPKEYIL